MHIVMYSAIVVVVIVVVIVVGIIVVIVVVLIIVVVVVIVVIAVGTHKIVDAGRHGARFILTGWAAYLKATKRNLTLALHL